MNISNRDIIFGIISRVTNEQNNAIFCKHVFFLRKRLDTQRSVHFLLQMTNTSDPYQFPIWMSSSGYWNVLVFPSILHFLIILTDQSEKSHKKGREKKINVKKITIMSLFFSLHFTYFVRVFLIYIFVVDFFMITGVSRPD